MKKSLFLALVIAAMASCSQNEVVIDGSTASKPISFAPQFGNSVATRTDAGLGQSITLGVYAYNSNSIYDEIENLPLAYTSSGTVGWYLTPKDHYYPNDDSEVSFWAYGPKDESHLSSTACNVTNGPSFTLTLANTDKDMDILATQAVATGKKSTATTPIAFTLKHVLAQVKFKAKVNSTENANTFDVKIYEITIKTKGKANYSNKAWSNFGGDDVTWAVIDTEGSALTASAADAGAPVNLIPKQATTITVKAKVYKKGETVVISDQTATLTTNGSTPAHLEQGNCYTYTINVTPNVGKIEFAEPQVTGWVDQSGDLAPVIPAP